MKIDINKDFEEQYKNELWKGFTARELAYAGIALFVAGIISVWNMENNGACNQYCYLCGNSFYGTYYLSCNGKASGTYLDRVFKNIWFYLTNERTACEMKKEIIHLIGFFYEYKNNQRTKEKEGEEINVNF